MSTFIFPSAHNASTVTDYVLINTRK